MIIEIDSSDPNHLGNVCKALSVLSLPTNTIRMCGHLLCDSDHARWAGLVAQRQILTVYRAAGVCCPASFAPAYPCRTESGFVHLTNHGRIRDGTFMSSENGHTEILALGIVITHIPVKPRIT